MKAQPSDRMKTEEELAKEEQERLRRLEVRGRWGRGCGPPVGPPASIWEGDELLLESVGPF